MNRLATTRRTVLAGAGATALSSLTSAPGQAATASSALVTGGRSRPDEPYFAYVGSRTTAARQARGEGITVWRVDPRGGWTLVQTVPADNGAGTSNGGQAPVTSINPSFLALSQDGRNLYAVHGDDTRVSAFAVDQGTGALSLLGTVGIGRRNPVHLSVDPSGRWLVVATLAVPGHIVSLSIGQDGSLGPVASSLTFPGTPGPHKTSQVGANPHHAVFDPSGRWIVVPDRGLDRVFVATLDPGTGALALNDPGWVPTRELEGPRHIAFHPDRRRAYMVAELRCDVTTYAWDDAEGSLRALQVLPSHSPSFTADVRGGEVQVHPSGRTVYVSNRSGAGDETPGGPAPDTIGVFRVDRRTGLLQVRGWVSTQGIRPRFFGLTPSGRSLYVANEVTNSVAGFGLGPEGSMREERGLVARTGSPVSIVFAPRP